MKPESLIYILVFQALFGFEVFFSSTNIFSGDLIYIFGFCRNEKLTNTRQNGKSAVVYHEKNGKFHLFTGSDVEFFSGKLELVFMTEHSNYRYSFPVNMRKTETRLITFTNQTAAAMVSDRKKIISESRSFHEFYKAFTEPYWKGNFISPAGHAPVSSDFAVHRSNSVTGVQSFHRGIDFLMPSGAQVYAPNHGIVVFSGFADIRGNLVIINHGMGLYTSYFHLEKSLVKTGQKIKKGEIIALSGKSGLVTGAHLHWDVRIDNTCVNGTDLLKMHFPPEP
ncbi:MAG: hypothetical protein A2096_12735 [Spirochaetes bacterium GWF1_41_5]|nr:MAG: hypothetical protein A2096_12735 [Spirochaetes bacterium GWF1_41_5]